MERTHLDKEGLDYTLQKINQKYEAELLKRLKQYTVLPTASEVYAGQIVQYIGETTEDYEKSQCYECKIDEETGDYIWASFSVTGKLVRAVLSEEVIPEASSDYNENLIIYTGVTDENYIQGHMYYCEMISGVYGFTDLTPETSIPDNETIIKDPQTGVISVSPKYKIAFIGEQDDWDALTSEQKAIFDGNLVIITDDYIDDEGSYTAIDEIVPDSNNLVKSKALAEAIEWSQDIIPIVRVAHTEVGAFHQSLVSFGRNVKPNDIAIYRMMIPRNNGKVIHLYLMCKNLTTSVSIRLDDINSNLIPGSDNDHKRVYLIIENTTEYEYSVVLNYQANATGYGTNESVCYIQYNNLDKSSKQSMTEALVGNANAQIFTIS